MTNATAPPDSATSADVPNPRGGGASVQPLPTPGDHLTLYTLEEASPFLKLHHQTLRKLVKSSDIPGRYITRVGAAAGRGTKLFMSGDQIHGLLAYWRERTAAERPTGNPPIRRRRAAA
jgi:hypothetical protein